MIGGWVGGNLLAVMTECSHGRRAYHSECSRGDPGRAGRAGREEWPIAAGVCAAPAHRLRLPAHGGGCHRPRPAEGPGDRHPARPRADPHRSGRGPTVSSPSPPAVVLDASATVALLADDGPAGAWVAKIVAGAALFAPELMPFEAANILRRQTLAGLLDPSEAALAHTDLAA